uniref:Uncharacterized protein n=2 Tax=viral metagenome TaxID=1070528 RepID=A0A6H2A1X4_9ZZZZ
MQDKIEIKQTGVAEIVEDVVTEMLTEVPELDLWIHYDCPTLLTDLAIPKGAQHILTAFYNKTNIKLCDGEDKVFKPTQGKFESIVLSQVMRLGISLCMSMHAVRMVGGEVGVDKFVKLMTLKAIKEVIENADK